MFLGKYYSGSEEFQHVFKLIFVLLPGQSFIARGISINKQFMDITMKGKSLVSQHIVYDKITSDNISISSFVITPELQKSCMLAIHHYKELENIKRRKVNLQTTINRLRDSVEQETLSTDKNQDLIAISKAAALLDLVYKKEKTL